MLDLLPDLFDQFPEELTLVTTPFHDYGKKILFSGEIVTVDCFNDNSKVISNYAYCLFYKIKNIS